MAASVELLFSLILWVALSNDATLCHPLLFPFPSGKRIEMAILRNESLSLKNEIRLLGNETPTNGSEARKNYVKGLFYFFFNSSTNLGVRAPRRLSSFRFTRPCLPFGTLAFALFVRRTWYSHQFAKYLRNQQ